MIRLLASLVLTLLANTIGLLVAALWLDDFSIDSVSFIIAIGIFTLVEVVLSPFVMKMALRYVPALLGGIALVTTFVGLWITDTLSDGLSIHGFRTYVLATLIVWLFSLIANLLLPLVIFKKALDKRRRPDNNLSQA